MDVKYPSRRLHLQLSESRPGVRLFGQLGMHTVPPLAVSSDSRQLAALVATSGVTESSCELHSHLGSHTWRVVMRTWQYHLIIRLA
jgi:hypothetical protein